MPGGSKGQGGAALPGTAAASQAVVSPNGPSQTNTRQNICVPGQASTVSAVQCHQQGRCRCCQNLRGEAAHGINTGGCSAHASTKRCICARIVATFACLARPLTAAVPQRTCATAADGGGDSAPPPTKPAPSEPAGLASSGSACGGSASAQGDHVSLRKQPRPARSARMQVRGADAQWTSQWTSRAVLLLCWGALPASSPSPCSAPCCCPSAAGWPPSGSVKLASQ